MTHHFVNPWSLLSRVRHEGSVDDCASRHCAKTNHDTVRPAVPAFGYIARHAVRPCMAQSRAWPTENTYPHPLIRQIVAQLRETEKR
jgi:hypothetical protein